MWKDRMQSVVRQLTVMHVRLVGVEAVDCGLLDPVPVAVILIEVAHLRAPIATLIRFER
jgi:hypothetical protein